MRLEGLCRVKGLCEMPPMIAHRAIVCTGGAIRIQGFGSTAPTVCRPSLPCLGTMASAQLPKTVGQCRHMKQVAATCQSCVALGSAQRPNTPVVIQIQSVLRFNTHHLCCTRGRCTCFPTYCALLIGLLLFIFLPSAPQCCCSQPLQGPQLRLHLLAFWRW